MPQSLFAVTSFALGATQWHAGVMVVDQGVYVCVLKQIAEVWAKYHLSLSPEP